MKRITRKMRKQTARHQRLVIGLALLTLRVQVDPRKPPASTAAEGQTAPGTPDPGKDGSQTAEIKARLTLMTELLNTPIYLSGAGASTPQESQQQEKARGHRAQVLRQLNQKRPE